MDRSQAIVWRLSLVLLAVLVFLLAIAAKRSQYPDSFSNNPYLANAVKMSEARSSRCGEVFIVSAIRVLPALVPIARAVAAPDPVLPRTPAAVQWLQFRPPPSYF